jgi:hypothetical protein
MPNFQDYLSKLDVKPCFRAKAERELIKAKNNEMKLIIQRGPPYNMTGVLSKN